MTTPSLVSFPSRLRSLAYGGKLARIGFPLRACILPQQMVFSVLVTFPRERSTSQRTVLVPCRVSGGLSSCSIVPYIPPLELSTGFLPFDRQISSCACQDLCPSPSFLQKTLFFSCRKSHLPSPGSALSLKLPLAVNPSCVIVLLPSAACGDKYGVSATGPFFPFSAKPRSFLLVWGRHLFSFFQYNPFPCQLVMCRFIIFNLSTLPLENLLFPLSAHPGPRTGSLVFSFISRCLQEVFPFGKRWFRFKCCPALFSPDKVPPFRFFFFHLEM